MSGHMA